jgi:hypothetical protein
LMVQNALAIHWNHGHIHERDRWLRRNRTRR